MALLSLHLLAHCTWLPLLATLRKYFLEFLFVFWKLSPETSVLYLLEVLTLWVTLCNSSTVCCIAEVPPATCLRVPTSELHQTLQCLRLWASRRQRQHSSKGPERAGEVMIDNRWTMEWIFPTVRGPFEVMTLLRMELTFDMRGGHQTVPLGTLNVHLQRENEIAFRMW